MVGYKISHFLFGEVSNLKDIKAFLKYFEIRQRITKREIKLKQNSKSFNRITIEPKQ